MLGSPRQGAGEEKVPPERGSFGRRQSGTSWFVAESPSRVVARLPQRPRKWAGLAGTFSRFGPSTPSGQRPPQRLPTACVLLNSSALANPPTVLVASRRTATRAMLGATWLSTVSYFTGRLHRQIGCLLPQNQRAAALRHCSRTVALRAELISVGQNILVSCQKHGMIKRLGCRCLCKNRCCAEQIPSNRNKIMQESLDYPRWVSFRGRFAKLSLYLVLMIPSMKNCKLR